MLFQGDQRLSTAPAHKRAYTSLFFSPHQFWFRLAKLLLSNIFCSTILSVVRFCSLSILFPEYFLRLLSFLRQNVENFHRPPNDNILILSDCLMKTSFIDDLTYGSAFDSVFDCIFFSPFIPIKL
jgi:hypothetical protein